MSLIYRCSECGKVIDSLEAGEVDESKLGFNVLTAKEREDIIETRENDTYVNVTCDDCIRHIEGTHRGNNFKIH